MIVRIVRMEFQPERVEDFLKLFRETMSLIRNFPGVRHLELHRDHHYPHVFYTYSHWQSQADLDAYRDSALFAEVWSRTKALFGGKPMAFSLQKEIEVPA